MLTVPSGRSLAGATIPATTLVEALDALEPEPLAFQGNHPSGEKLYIPPPARMDGDEGLRVAGPGETLLRALLDSTFSTKRFLSGHVGSGKSTELNRLAADERIQTAFFPILLEIEEGYRQNLNIAQLLYLMACELFAYADKNKLLSETDAWAAPFRDLDQRLFGEAGLRATQGTTGVELSLFFVKLRQELKFEEKWRRRFRELGETQLTLLLDLVRGLVLDIETTASRRGDGRSPLLLIDDLDKVSEPEPQEDVFRKNTSSLFSPPLRIVYTVPTGVAFERCPLPLRQTLVHLYPAPVLKKAPSSFEPEEAINEIGLHFLQTVLSSRVAPGLFDTEAIRKAAAYSGGVLRNFFWLLRTSIDIARDNDLQVVDGRVMRVAIKTLRLRESQALRGIHYKALAEVHRTNDLTGGADGSYLDDSRVIECFNDKIWYEANPLLWKLLEPYSR